MSSQNLNGKKVAILVTDMFEQVELTEPRKALEEAGAQTVLVSPSKNQVQGFHHFDKADTFPVDLPLDNAQVDEFDALLLPGGVGNPDQLRMNPKAVAFVRSFAEAGKPIAAICHGPWLLVEAGAARGRTITSWPSLKTDILNAGGTWVDQETAVDRGIVTSRNPGDIPAFNARMLEEFGRAKQQQQRMAS